MPLYFDPSAPASHEGIFGLPFTPEESRVVVIPVPWEPTTSYRKGTAGGPAAILEASRQVDLYDRDTGRPYEAGIAMLTADREIVAWNREACELAQPIIDLGGAGEDDDLKTKLDWVNQMSRRADERIYEIAKTQLDAGKLVGLVGGDHSTPFGLIRALAERNHGLGILHIDAHADLRQAYEGFERSHASIMFNVHEQILDVGKIVQVGIRDVCEAEVVMSRKSPRIETFFDTDMARRQLSGESFSQVAAEVIAALPSTVYISFDIDGLDPSQCPNTGTPVPGGLSFREACLLLELVRNSGRKIVGFDLNEVGSEEWDAIVGARMLYKMIGHTLLSQAD